MSIVKDVASRFQADLNTIMSSPMDWAEITISITAKCSAADATITSRMDWTKEADLYGPTWRLWQKPTASEKSTLE